MAHAAALVLVILSLVLGAVLPTGLSTGLSTGRSTGPSTGTPTAPSTAPSGATPPTESATTPAAEPEEFTFVSPSLSAFWGRPITMRCAVLAPTTPSPDAPPRRESGELHSPSPDTTPPAVCYIIHGFGGSHRMAWRHGARLAEKIRRGDAPPMLYVYLDASCRFGHHEFADSVNNGPWGEALVDEFIPAIESRFGGARPPARRFLTGHSSGGWSVLWLQVNYPDRFGGCWATAPDSIDFRDFSGVDLTSAENLYRDAADQPRPLIERDGTPVSDIESYVRSEVKADPIGGQFFSFDAVFSPRGDDGLPMPMFDRESGAIDREVLEAWKRYDIALILRTRWAELAPALAGKLHVWCGEWDTFRLDGAVRLLKQDLAALGSDADILIVPERDHGSIVRPHPEFWPDGMESRVWSEMAAAAARALAAEESTPVAPVAPAVPEPASNSSR